MSYELKISLDNLRSDLQVHTSLICLMLEKDADRVSDELKQATMLRVMWLTSYNNLDIGPSGN